MKEKDNDAIAKLQEAIEYSGNKWSEWGERAEHVGELLDEALAILRKHDESEADGEQYNRPADTLAHLKDYPGARDRLIDLLANECWSRSFVADCFAKYDEIQSRPAPTDEKALEALEVVYNGNELAAERGESIKNWPMSYARKLAREVLYPSLGLEAPKEKA